MGDVDETAKLWKVNRTIHELVRDRVCSFLSDSNFAQPMSGLLSLRRGNPYGSPALSRSLRQQHRNSRVSRLPSPPHFLTPHQPQPAQLLLHLTNQLNRSDLCLLHRRKERRCKNNAQVSSFSATLNRHPHPSQASRHSRRQVHPTSHHSLPRKYDPFSPQSEITGLPDPPQKTRIMILFTGYSCHVCSVSTRRVLRS